MSSQLTAATATYAVILAILAAVAAIRPPKRRGALLTGAVVLEVLLVIHAVVSVWTQLRGHRPAEPVIHGLYLGCSVLLFPVLAFRPDATGRTRWDDAVLAVAALIMAVVSVRTLATWAS